jgi:molecular chaperone IbpA
VVKYGKGKYGLEIGLAGYNKENVLVEVKDGILTVEGKVEDKNIDYVQKGLAYRKFIKQFELASDVIIDEAEMVDGLLKIKLGFKKPKEVEGVKVKVK